MPRHLIRCVRCRRVLVPGDERYLIGLLCPDCLAAEVRRLGDIPNSSDDLERPDDPS